jgi:uncharacterized peroxidase-related enzyme
MALLSIPTNENADPEAQILFGHCEQIMGRVANAVRVAAHSPKVAQPLVGFLVAILRTEVTGLVELRIKLLVILKTSFINGCRYCVGHNVALGRSIGMSDEEIAAIEGEHRASDLFTPAENAALDWAEYLTERSYRRHPEAVPELKKHFDEAQIVEISLVSGFFNMWNRFVDALQVDLEPEAMVGGIRKSRVVRLEDYEAMMRDGWWRTPAAEATAAD